MKSFARARSSAALLLAFMLLASPMTALAKKGEKNFKRGIQAEQAQQWEKAAQEFALAVAANPSDTEYQLHYRRAVFNASQVFMTKGRALADQGDYVGAYNAFRTAYGLDPVNDLAVQEMDRVLRLQREKEGTAPAGATRTSPTVYRPGGAGSVRPGQPDGRAEDPLPPTQAEQLQIIQYSGDLEPFIRQLADKLNLNVVFDQNFSQVKRTINVRWKDITPARALDYLFMSQGLFYQKLDRRTILVADQGKRPQYQQLVLRTFYLYNIKPQDARQLLTGALPANSGRQPTFVENANTNSITVRDTPENIRIIEKLLKSVDKDRSEVVMDVSIYEISRADLLQIGNQIGSQTSLSNLGGVQPGSFLIGGARQIASGATGGGVFPLSTGVGLLIPSTTLSAVQSKTNTRLLFSTQVHAFDDEKSETRVGSKVPVQTASVFSGISSTPTGTGSGTGGVAGTSGVFGNGFPVIQYEDVGLNLDFKPKVYPNQDVQVTMTIESKDQTAGPDPLTPIFTQRKIAGVARIPNGKTMMIASISQDRQSSGRAGLPLVGLIPILGRLFTAPRKDNSNSDIVITMTPRVLRSPEITPEDEETKDTGSMQQPKSESLEAMLRQADREDQLARARQLPTNQTVELKLDPAATEPKQPQPGQEVAFVPAPKELAAPAQNNSAPANAAAAPVVNAGLGNSFAGPVVAADASPAPPVPRPAVNTAAATARPAAVQPASAESTAELLMLPEAQDLKVGERRRVMVFMKTDAPVGLVTATLRFDPRALAVRSVAQGVLAADKTSAPVLTQSVDAGRGVLVVSVAPAAGASPLSGEGLLLVVEVEALAPGEAALQFDADKVHLIATDGRTVRPRLTAGKFKIAQ
ncbi:MAG TPA: secretin N-terminal domain-containing protein [Pyrinomonadaceae bacterium]|jgi:general secretion pathway protein D|nr:secretin N-terminal domain-containing protein [Pyrinomonadaceae bacterium]